MTVGAFVSRHSLSFRRKVAIEYLFAWMFRKFMVAFLSRSGSGVCTCAIGELYIFPGGMSMMYMRARRGVYIGGGRLCRVASRNVYGKVQLEGGEERQLPIRRVGDGAHAQRAESRAGGNLDDVLVVCCG